MKRFFKRYNSHFTSINSSYDWRNDSKVFCIQTFFLRGRLHPAKNFSTTNIGNRCTLVPAEPVTISTFNTRTLNSIVSVNELLYHAVTQQNHIICIQEHRLLHAQEVKYNYLGNGWQLVTSSATQNSQGAAIGGVGFLLSPAASKSLQNVNHVNPRLLTANFAGEPACDIITCYSPTSTGTKAAVNTFYEGIQMTVNDIPKQNTVIICGDFNAKLGKNKFDCNRNGELMLKFIKSNDLIPVNRQLEKPLDENYTFESPGGGRSQIDFILLYGRHINILGIVYVDDSFKSVGSDHRLVSAKFTLNFKTHQNSSYARKHNYMVNANHEFASKYLVRWKNNTKVPYLSNDPNVRQVREHFMNNGKKHKEELKFAYIKADEK
ncbi:craniofacial development protein 2-like [Anneissia japonica]|uniref:craniofacial development protein 2-like n=1 Tax=Anneissia japonica TaxID=1529436 RepID=UPI0014257244|nr:craniofacial development protein 2-like [Anneissia japonica]